MLKLSVFSVRCNCLPGDCPIGNENSFILRFVLDIELTSGVKHVEFRTEWKLDFKIEIHTPARVHVNIIPGSLGFKRDNDIIYRAHKSGSSLGARVSCTRT